MKKSLILWQVGGMTAVAVLGTLLHFLYDWTGSAAVAPFSAVNESTWEHMKLFFYPAALYAVVQCFFFRKEYPDFWCVKLLGILTGLLLIPVLFYTLNGAFGKTPDWVNITIFFISLIFAFLLEWRLFVSPPMRCAPIVAIIVLVGLCVAFVAFTYLPPHIPLFLDPVTKTYGVQ